MQILRTIDDIAYPRYAATTKRFRSGEDFSLEASALARIEDKWGWSVSSAFRVP